MLLNRADECRQRADECRRNAHSSSDDVLRGTYLDLARRWHTMAHQAESLEQKEFRSKKTQKTLDRPDELFNVRLALLDNIKQLLRAFA
jgi:hypothetical protein